jgi:molecular chaperone GrpE
VTDDPRKAEPSFRVTDKRRSARGLEGADSTAPSAPAAAAEEVADVTNAETIDEHASQADSIDATAVGPDELASARNEAQEYMGHLQRLQAEFDNYRKRAIKEQNRMLELAAEPVVRRLLEVVDDFELALLHAETEERPELEPFMKGFELVFAKLVDALRAEGLERIDADGRPFDPELHEALMQSGEGEGEPVVAEVFRNGYTLRGRVIRPAGVRVERS